LVAVAIPSSSWAAEKARLRVDNYQIEAELDPHLHQITARAKVKFTATQDLASPSLSCTMICGSPGFSTKKGRRCRPSESLRIRRCGFRCRQACRKNASTTLTFEYEGQLENADNSPVPGLKLAYIGDDTSYLFYSGRWFPVSGLRPQPLHLDD
jgi:hypothetical protein